MPRKATTKAVEQPLNPDDGVPVISLCPMRLTISTEGFGRGRLYNFDRFGQRHMIPYRDLVQILNAHSNFAEQGYFYILDKRVVQNYGLTAVYEHVLTKEMLERVFEMKDGAVELYQNATDAQKDFIRQVLVTKIVNDEPVDFNLLAAIEKLSGVNFVQLGREAKERKQEEETK